MTDEAFPDVTAGAAPGRVLVVLHQEHSTPGRVGRLLQQKGLTLDVRRPRFGDPLPCSLRDHVGAVVFGGPMSANDEEDYVRREIDWIGVPLREGKPFLGICLGAQMLTRHLGCRVTHHPTGRVEIGYYEIAPTAIADDVCGTRFPRHVYHWHKEGFELPSDASLLATGEHFECQAYRHGDTAYGFQFHPEVTYAMMCRWTTKAHERLAQPGAQARHHHLDGWYQHDRAVAAWTSAFLDRWLGRPCRGQSVMTKAQ